MEVVKGLGDLEVPTPSTYPVTTSIAGILRQTAEYTQILVVTKAKAVAIYLTLAPNVESLQISGVAIFRTLICCSVAGFNGFGLTFSSALVTVSRSSRLTLPV